MAIIPIRKFPDPVLRRKAKSISIVGKSLQNDKAFQKLIDDMFETMRDAHGVGLAAPQIGLSIRLAVIGIPSEEEDGEEKHYVLVNPEIIKKEGERELEEGCLSVPGYRGELKRAEIVRMKALDRNGKEYRLKANGLLAEAIEHEIGHLNGELYIDLLESSSKLYELVDTEGKASEETGPARNRSVKETAPSK